MKHAFLILAHDQFDVLARLIRALDDKRNDVFIHIDKRVKTIPSLKMDKGNLQVLDNRIKTYWGDSSLLKAEMLLMQTAFSFGNYKYYHIISGVHFPLKDQDTIHTLVDSNYPKSLLIPMETSRGEIEYKIGRYHFFVHSLAPRGTFRSKAANFLWRSLLFVQKPFPVRNIAGIDMKASQWCSLSDIAVKYLVAHKDEALKRFRHTFCCDEFFVPTMLGGVGLEYVAFPQLMYVKFRRFSPKVLTDEDYAEMVSSGCLFARKFGGKSKELMDRIERESLWKG